MSEILSSIGFQLGAGGIGGFIVGFALKKIGKIIAIIMGLFIAALIYLGYQGIINVNYQALFDAVAGAFGLAGAAFSWLAGAISLLPFAGTFVLGLPLGFKLG